ncbi:probable LRR receptor-like serine/threonine-protein kinase At1g67720 [Morus notabilis]|uniref:probable LRR receptor-like serine/threonine-protein kinase At1g67720 n=1 Tax=Morus notabilis TaxID=981085 RepID=UPI000CED1BA1|nr:probable LRR receptor-like serine/threonine-protein kinase At1g67720 [Morus notabilis]
MSSFVVFFILSLFSLFPLSLSQPKGILIDCGATTDTVIEGRRWRSDANFVSGGTPKALEVTVLDPTLSTVRSFPNDLNRKFCYTVRVYRGARYMVRTTYFYGGINGRDSPPVFDQMVDGTLWSVVNTTSDYANGMSSYYEGVFLAQGSTMSVCIGASSYTDSDPFISALEFVIFDDSLYNSTDFKNFGLHLVERTSFGYAGSVIRYPDDKFDRFWEPLGKENHTLATSRNISVSGFWNVPPLKIFETGLTTGQTEPLELNWPLVSLPDAKYYIALYFADTINSSSANSRVFNISINGVTYYRDLNVTPAGVVVFATQWPLSGFTRITLTPSHNSNSGPLINGGEIFEVLPLGGRTLTRDVIALVQFKDSLENPPLDWNGDPCLPRQYSWTGITCSEGPRIRVLTLNLTGMSLSGTLSPGIANMTALNSILLGNNRLSGTIPDLSSLKRLERLHLEDNQFSGEIPSSLGDIASLRELFLQNNNLTGDIPSSLKGKTGLDLRVSGNSLSSPPPS